MADPFGQFLSGVNPTAGLLYNQISDPNIDLIPGVDNPYNNSPSVPSSRGGFLAGLVNDGAKQLANFLGSGQSTTKLDLGAATPSGAGASAAAAADERAYYDDQINSLNRLLGLTSTQRDTGLTNLQSAAQAAQQRLADQKTKALSGYDTQAVENSQDKQRGVESVDQFARNSYNSLQRLLQGGNAANSSVGRLLVPQLVSKAAGTRRTGVFDTAGRNERDITSARGNAIDEFNLSEEDLRNQQATQEQSFRQGILGEENRILGERRAAEIAKAQANGAGYGAARAAAQGTEAGINDRTAQLSALFSQFKPTFNARATNLQTPELSKFTVDPAQIKTANSGLPTESSYYLNQLRKKQEQA